MGTPAPGAPLAVSASGNGEDFRGNQGPPSLLSPQPQRWMLLSTPIPPVPLSAASSSFQQPTPGMWQIFRDRLCILEELCSAFPEGESPRMDVREFSGELLQSNPARVWSTIRTGSAPSGALGFPGGIPAASRSRAKGAAVPVRSWSHPVHPRGRGAAARQGGRALLEMSAGGKAVRNERCRGMGMRGKGWSEAGDTSGLRERRQLS